LTLHTLFCITQINSSIDLQVTNYNNHTILTTLITVILHTSEYIYVCKKRFLNRLFYLLNTKQSDKINKRTSGTNPLLYFDMNHNKQIITRVADDTFIKLHRSSIIMRNKREREMEAYDWTISDICDSHWTMDSLFSVDSFSSSSSRLRLACVDSRLSCICSTMDSE